MNVTTPVWPAPAVKGMQGQTWSETVRTETQHEEMTYPRVLAVAERAWHRGSWELDWTPNQNYHATSDNVPKDQLAMDFKGFNTVLGCREVRKIWQRLAIKYRVPPPGATIEAGILTANSELPCTRIQYSIDGGVNWSEYLSPVDLGEGKFVSLKSLSADGVLESRIVDIDQEECVGCQGVCESNPLMPFNTSQICISGNSSAITLPPLGSNTETTPTAMPSTSPPSPSSSSSSVIGSEMLTVVSWVALLLSPLFV
jgi:hexosaminidase